MACVYRHIRLDKNEPFYIGIGKDSYRAYDKSRRNKHWYNIVDLGGYDIEILFDDLTLDEAREKEKEFIKIYGRRDCGTGTLCNHTDGGEGANGRIYKPTQETIEKIRLKRIGLPSKKRGIPLSEEAKIKISNSLKGKKQSSETIEKRRLSCVGKKRSEQSRLNISKGKTGVPFSDSHKLNILNAKRKDVYRIDEDGNIVNKFISIKQASLECGIKANSLRAYFSSKRKYINGLIFVKEGALLNYGQQVIQSGE
jgi:hypothetical protein